MAIYHCTFKMIKRSEGKSAVAAAAYRSGEKIENVYDGVIHDYTRKEWVTHKEIMLPPGAPREWQDRSRLWNAVELSADHPKDRLARECEVALPIELTPEQQIELVRKFARAAFVSQGMCADVCCHCPPVKDDKGRPLDSDGNITNDRDRMQFINPHAHILLTCRPLNSDGTWQKKSSTRYVCRRGSEEKLLSGAEYKQLKADGWEKQYRYCVNGENIWLTPSAAEKRNLAPEDRVFKGAMQTHKNTGNEILQYWDSTDFVRDTRKCWADYVNRALETAGFEERVDYRSFQEQGREDEIPTEHIGPGARYADCRYERTGEGEQTDKGFINDRIRDHNESAKARREAAAEIHDKLHNAAWQLQHLRVAAATAEYADALVSTATLAADAGRYHLDEMEIAERELRTIDMLQDAALKTIEDLLHLLETVGSLTDVAAAGIFERIERERRGIETRNTYREDILHRYGCEDVEAFYLKFRQFQQEAVETEQKKQNAEMARSSSRTAEDSLAEYRKILDSIPASLRKELEKEQNGLEDDHDFPGEAMNPEEFQTALARVDARIAEIRGGEGREERMGKERGRGR